MSLCTIIDYGSGNLRSAAKAFERAAPADVTVRVSSNPADVAAADHVVLPGVGAYADCRAGLDAVPGMVESLERRVREEGRPFLGICVGMQLMSTRGREFTVTEGLGWIPGEVTALSPSDRSLKIPHMGWNDLTLSGPPHPALSQIRSGQHAYFVHSFALACERAEDRLATVDYGGPVTAIVGRDNLLGTQFHPEKSQETGLELIAGFLAWRP